MSIETNIASQEAFGAAVNSSDLDALVAPSGGAVQVRGLQISRFEDGKLAERWGSSDHLDLLTQLGLA